MLLGSVGMTMYGQTTVFFDGFESGSLDTFWTANPGVANGFAGVVSSTNSCGGSHHLSLGKTADAGGWNTASVDLHMSLGTYIDSQLTLSFCIYDYHDETQASDGVFVSANNGISFTKMISFEPNDWTNGIWGERVPYDLDQLLISTFGSVPSNFILRFQQRGTGDFSSNWPNPDTDGILIDNIRIRTEKRPVPKPIPFYDDFSSGSLGEAWKISSRVANDSLGRNNLTRFPRVNIAGNGNYLHLGKSRDYEGHNLNAIDLYLTLGNYVDSQLIFSFRSYDAAEDDHPHVEGIYASINNGKDFKQIITFEPIAWVDGIFGKRVPYDLDQLIKDKFSVLNLPDTLILRFQQLDAGDFSDAWPDTDKDGILLDNISISVEKKIVPQTLPYCDGFSTGVLGNEWRVSSREANDSIGGNYLTRFPRLNIAGNGKHLHFGKTSDIEGHNLNAIDLYLQLGTHVDSQLLLSFTTYDAEEDNHPNLEGIYASIDNGISFRQIINFFPTNWTNNTFGRRVPYDLDKLIRDEFLTSNLPDTLILRFQQVDGGDFSNAWPNTEMDGILLDDICITIDPAPTYASIPYVDDFEMAKFGPEWKISSEKALGKTTTSSSLQWLDRFYRLGVSNNTGSFSGSYLVWMGKTSDLEGGNLNALDLHVNLKGESQVQLTYRIFKVFDEYQYDDGIWISVNGGKNFEKIHDFNLAAIPNQSWRTHNLDLSALAAAMNPPLVLSDSTIIRFQQYGTGDLNTSGDEDGFAIDKVEINCLGQVADFSFDVDCSTLQVDFSDSTKGTNVTTPYAWDFDGDGIIDTIANGNISHIYPSTGTYNVTLIIGNLEGCGDSITKQVFIGSLVPAPTLTPSGPQVDLCDGDTLSLSAQIGFQGYLWNTGATGQTIAITSPGTYSVRGLGIDGCYSVPTTITVTGRPAPLAPFISLIGQTEFCEGDSVELVAPFGASSYLWNTGDVTQTIIAKTSGVYSVQIANSFGCLSPTSDTTITVLPIPPKPVISQASGTNWLTSSSMGQTYQWFHNGTPISPDSQAIDAGLYGAGNYTVTVINGMCDSEPSDPFAFTISALEEDWLGTMTVYPNPTQDVAVLDLKRVNLSPLSYRLYNAMGQRVLPISEIPAERTWRHKLDLSHLPAGVYMLRIQSSENFSTVRIIKY